MSNPHCTDCQPTEPSAAPVAVAAPRPADSDPLLDTATFEPPDLASSDTEVPRVVIEFCDRCRWLHRATWTQTELFLTFPPSPPPAADASPDAPAPPPGLRAITLVPRNAPETGGRFRVWLLRKESERTVEEGKEKWRGWDLAWDRKVEGRFPEMKELKQRIRNLIAPSQSLGHSDKPTHHAAAPPPSAPSASAAASSEPAVEADPPAQEEESAADHLSRLLEQSSADPQRKEGQLTAADFEPRYRCI
ncbi:hypothetical protein JCM10207_007686 [Rhodosporidiobolus poonsookiae]